MHIAIIGTGRVGRPTAYSIMCAELADTLTVCDIKPGLAAAFAEELTHVTASTGTNVTINSTDQDEGVNDADLILITAGEPRLPGVKMTRRDLALQNARIIKTISQAVAPRNPNAKYVVVSNPVDAMGMVCKRYTGAKFVISTGTNLESLRFRTKIAQLLKVPTAQVQGWVGGEHGDAAVPLWSTTRIDSQPIDQYLSFSNKTLSRDEVACYVKAVSKQIVDNIGGTEYGPAASFRDIVRAITKNTNEILSIAIPMQFPDLPESVFVGLPTHLGKTTISTLYDKLTNEEQASMLQAAKTIYETYQISIKNINSLG